MEIQIYAQWKLETFVEVSFDTFAPHQHRRH